MAGFFTLDMVNIRKPEVHKGWMTLLLINMMTPAIARVFLVVLAATAGSAAVGGGGPPPPFVAIPPAMVGDLLLVVALVHDWRTRGRPHPVYVYAGAVTLATPFLICAFANTRPCMPIAQ